MRLYFAIIIIALNSALGFGQEAEFSFDKAVHKFPKTYEGELLSHDFIISNDGQVPLVISDYHVQCPCTKVILPEEPILPGETFPLKVTFDTSGKYYFQDRTIILKTNSKSGEEKIRIKVNVIPKAE